jgi:hypothetical protein
MTQKRLSPLKAIKKHCLDCSGGSRHELQNCVIPDCPLYPYRLGRNSARKGIGGSPKLMNPKTTTQVESFDQGTALNESPSGDSP